MQNNNNLDVIRALREKLPQYLASQNIAINEAGFFSCIHPDHVDRNPSCSMNRGNGQFEGQVFHCFSGVGHDGNIFTAAHWLEGMPLVGAEFWDVTIKTLADRYNIPYSPMEISEDQKRRYQALRAISDSVKIINRMTRNHDNEFRTTHIGIKHLLDRGITEASIKKHNIGVLTSKAAFNEAIEKLGHTDKEFLASKGLAHHSLLNRDGFILPINDINGRPVGFVSRNCKLETNAHMTRKYSNSPNSDVYKKGEILFGYDKVKNVGGALYIVEGYLDAIYLQQEGLERTVALGSTTITDFHAEKVLYDNETEIILCLDADNGGDEGTKLAIERLAPFKKFNIKIIELPRDYDPDSYVREFGLKKFLELPQLTPFAWSLNHAEYKDDMITVAKNIIPTIAAEESSVERLSMIHELSNFTAIDEVEIKKDVDLLVNKKDDKYLEELSMISNFLQVKLNRSVPSETKGILSNALNKLETIEEKYDTIKDMRVLSRDRLKCLRADIVEGNYEYGLLAPRHSNIEKVLNGIPFKEKLMYFGGRGSAGKTAFMTSLALDVVEANPECALFYMSIDDSFDFLHTKMLAVRSGLPTTEIQNYKNLDTNKKAMVDDAHQFIDSISDRMVVADSTDGNSVETIENHLRWMTREYPKSKKVFVLDNFHKLSMENGTGQKRDAISDASSQLKDLAVKYKVCIMSSVELRKLGSEADRPTRQDMQGSNKLDYDADVVCMVHNDYQVNRSTHIIHEKEINGKVMVMPWVEVNIVKNKITGQLKECVFKYNAVNMQFEEGDYNTFTQLRSQGTTRKMSF